MPTPLDIDPALLRRAEDFYSLPRGRVRLFLADPGASDPRIACCPDAGTILFFRRPDAADPAFPRILAHEFCHAAQFAAGAARPGSGRPVRALEAQASVMEERFVQRLDAGAMLPAAPATPPLHWGPAGHFYTTYLCALMAGIDSAKAFQLAFFCQMTDQVEEFDAIAAVKAFAGGATARGATQWGGVLPVIGPTIATFGAIAGMNVRNVSREEMDAVHIGLHCLTGGPSDKATRVAGEIVRQHSYSLALCGMAIHLYGDSFAHRMIDNGKLMYAPGTGHGIEFPRNFDGHEPDYCSEHKVYPEYYRTLYAILASLPFATGRKYPDFQTTMLAFPSKHSEDAEIEFLRWLANATCGIPMSAAYRPEKVPDAMPFADFARAYAGFMGGQSINVTRAFHHARAWRNRLLA